MKTNSNMFRMLLTVLGAFSTGVFFWLWGDDLTIMAGITMMAMILTFLVSLIAPALSLPLPSSTTVVEGMLAVLCYFMVLGSGNTLFLQRPDLGFFKVLMMISFGAMVVRIADRALSALNELTE